MDTITEHDGDLPATARRLWKAADEAGWKVWATRAVAEHNGKTVTSVAVRMARWEHGKRVRLVAVWEGGRFTTGLRQSPFGKLGAREITALVTA